jgi:hypothetical protein
MQEKGEILLICPRRIKALLLPRLWPCGRSQTREHTDLLSTTRATSKAKGKTMADVAAAAALMRWVILDLSL